MRVPVVARQAYQRLPVTVRSALVHAGGIYAPWDEGFDFTPPALHGDEVAGPPEFVGVGVQKAGTSWWYSLIAEHPGVSDRDDVPKERHYLSRFAVEPFGPAEVARYHGWFPRRPGTIAGEWTPDYLCYPWVAPVLAMAAPEAKVLVLLRDPIERFRSGLTFRLNMGAPETSATVADAVHQGYYGRSLRRLYRHFPAEQVLVLQYERCRANPEIQLAATYAFLGLEAFEPPELRREVNVSRREKVPMDPGARQRLVDGYASDVADLVSLVPSIDLALWPDFAGMTS